MGFIERIEVLIKQQKAIEKKIDSLQNGLEHDEWTFCLHTYYEEPRVSVWKRGNDTDTSAVFIIKGDYVEMRSAGMYWANCQEPEKILNEWLAQDFLGEE